MKHPARTRSLGSPLDRAPASSAAAFDPVLRRRAFLRGAALLAGGAALPSWLPGCGGSSGDPAVPYRVDPSRPWWLQNNYEPVLDELEVFDLPVRGAIPPELDGIYVRNGSNAQKADNPHWFLGDGMLHGVRLRGGRAEWYRNRWIRTEPFLSGSASLAGLPQGGNNQSNVSPVYHAGRLLTSGEVGFPYEVDPDDLSTVGVRDFAGALTHGSFTAHSKIDPATGFLHFFGYWFSPPYLTYHVADASGRLISSEEIPVTRTTMIHSFAITESDVVFWELPVLFDGRGIEVHGFPFLWSDDFPARIGILPLGGPASALRWVEVEPAYVFHELNAFREGDDVVVDVCRYPRMMDGERFGTYEPHLHRWRIGTGGDDLRFRDERIDGSRQFEFPMHDRRWTGRPTRHGWFALPRTNPETIDVGGIAYRDGRTGELTTWDPGPNGHCGEPLFVPGGEGEGEGWLLTFLYDHARDVSDLAILDALDVAAGPIAEVRMPRRVPFGFHGAWIPR